MKLRAPFSRIVVSVLSAALSGALPGALAAGDAVLSGRVVAAATGTPLQGARVHVADPRNGEIHSSATTAADGSFAVRGLECSTYVVSVESDGGLYVADAPLAVTAGRDRAIELAVDPQTEPKPGSTPESGKAPPKKSKPSVWENPLTATLIVVGGAIVVGAIIGSGNNASTPVSPSQP